MDDTTVRVAAGRTAAAAALPVAAAALAAATPRPLRWAVRLRTAHLRWRLWAVDPAAVRAVALLDDDGVVAVAVAFRRDARARPAAVGGALAVVAAVAAVLPAHPAAPAAVAALLAVACVGAWVAAGASVGAVARRAAATVARDVGRERTWGAGVVAVAPHRQRRGHGRRVVSEMLRTLPHGHVWLPTAHTDAAARLYASMGATRVAGATWRRDVAETPAAP